MIYSHQGPYKNSKKDEWFGLGKNSLDQTQMEEYSKKLTMKIVAMTDYNKNLIDSNYGNHDVLICMKID